jgi:hypothetical protein
MPMVVSALVALLASGCAGWRTGAGLPDSPRELPYYAPEWAQSLRYEDLNVLITSRSRKGGNDVLTVEFSAFDQPIAGPDGLVTVRWRQRATLVLPASPLRTGKAMAFSVHDVAADLKWGTRSFLDESIDLASAYGIPVLVHGWQPDVVKSVDGGSFHATQDKAIRRLLATGVTCGGCLPMDGRFLFNGNPLAKADLVAHTLLQRLVERERGVQVTEIAAMGGSKEGHSHWIVGAIDPRVVVLAPGGMYWHDTGEFLRRYQRDLGWTFPWARDGDRKDGLYRLFETVWKLGDWVERTEAGRVVARTTLDPAAWYDEIRARHVVVHGDLGVWPEQHDAPWPFWAENAPLSRFSHPSWRYLRMYDGGGFMKGEMGNSLLPQIAELLVHDITTPDRMSHELVMHPGGAATLKLGARIATDVASEAAVLVGASPERGLRDPKYWKTLPMRSVGVGRWEVELAAPPAGHGTVVIAVVRERVQRGPLTFWRSASTLPIEVVAVPPLPPTPGPRWDAP